MLFEWELVCAGCRPVFGRLGLRNHASDGHACCGCCGRKPLLRSIRQLSREHCPLAERLDHPLDDLVGAVLELHLDLHRLLAGVNIDLSGGRNKRTVRVNQILQQVHVAGVHQLACAIAPHRVRHYTEVNPGRRHQVVDVCCQHSLRDQLPFCVTESHCFLRAVAQLLESVTNRHRSLRHTSRSERATLLQVGEQRGADHRFRGGVVSRKVKLALGLAEARRVRHVLKPLVPLSFFLKDLLDALRIVFCLVHTLSEVFSRVLLGYFQEALQQGRVILQTCRLCQRGGLQLVLNGLVQRRQCAHLGAVLAGCDRSELLKQVHQDALRSLNLSLHLVGRHPAVGTGEARMDEAVQQFGERELVAFRACNRIQAAGVKRARLGAVSEKLLPVLAVQQLRQRSTCRVLLGHAVGAVGVHHGREVDLTQSGASVLTHPQIEERLLVDRLPLNRTALLVSNQ